MALVGGFVGRSIPCARADTVMPPTLQGPNPDMLSGGVFQAREAAGLFGPVPLRPRARAGSAGAKGQPPAVLDARVGPNVRLNDDPTDLPAGQRGQAEPHIVRSATNPSVLLATFQEGRFFDAGSLDCGYGVSRDGGFTWTRALIPNLTFVSGGRFNRATDPVAGAGPQGDLYLQTLGSVSGAFTISAVVVSRSTDNGATWSAPITVFEPPNAQTMADKNWLAVNDYPAGTPNSGRLVSTWTTFLSSPTGANLSNPIVASISDDRGLTWTPPVNITPVGSSNQGTLPLFLPDGSLAVVYITFVNPSNVALFNILCKRSVDGGRTFPDTAATVLPIVAGWDDPDVRDGVFLPAACVARQSGDLFVTYTAVVSGTPRVLVTKSTDQGATWSTPPNIVSDNPTGISVMNPAITASADGRTVAVVFMDKRNAPDRRNFVDHYAALSFDGGITWQPNMRLSDISSDIRFAAGTSRGFMLGDYLGVAPPSASQPAVAVWCDTRTGDADPFTARFLLTEQADYAAWASVQAITGSHLDDQDGDGVPNYLEYVAGTNPRVAETGDDLVTRVTAPTTVDVAWTERAAVQLTFSAQGVAPTSWRFFEAGGFGLAGVAGATLPADQLPDVSPGPGRVWRGARITVEAGAAEVFARAYRHSAGLPVKASAVIATTQTDARVVNLSTRGRSGSGASQMIVGFVVDGGSKSVLLRAIGPTLAQFGPRGVLADPRLELIFGSLGQLQVFSVSNDDWATSPGVNAALFSRLGAFPLPTASKDAAIFQTLPPRSYTAIVSEPGNNGGVTLVEAYDADANPGAPANPRLVNVSTRGEVGAGDNALIAGFVLSGTQPRRVLIRAAGPSLQGLGVTGVLADPVLTLFRGSTEIAKNDDWEISRSGAAVAATAQKVGAFALTAASLDAALLITLAPGTYTAVVTSADGGTGIALIEVYDAD